MDIKQISIICLQKTGTKEGHLVKFEVSANDVSLGDILKLEIRGEASEIKEQVELEVIGILSDKYQGLLSKRISYFYHDPDDNFKTKIDVIH